MCCQVRVEPAAPSGHRETPCLFQQCFQPSAVSASLFTEDEAEPSVRPGHRDSGTERPGLGLWGRGGHRG